jgi:hypothetical protein
MLNYQRVDQGQLKNMTVIGFGDANRHKVDVFFTYELVRDFATIHSR